MAGDLAGLVSRLETVTNRLEAAAGGKGTRAPAGTSKIHVDSIVWGCVCVCVCVCV